MIIEELFAADTPEKRRNLKELCYRCTNYINEYKHGTTPPPKEMAQKLQITIEEYSELLNFIKNGDFDDLIRNQIQEDFENGATII